MVSASCVITNPYNLVRRDVTFLLHAFLYSKPLSRPYSAHTFSVRHPACLLVSKRSIRSSNISRHSLTFNTSNRLAIDIATSCNSPWGMQWSQLGHYTKMCITTECDPNRLWSQRFRILFHQQLLHLQMVFGRARYNMKRGHPKEIDAAIDVPNQ